MNYTTQLHKITQAVKRETSDVLKSIGTATAWKNSISI
jgi:hypothetical protein